MFLSKLFKRNREPPKDGTPSPTISCPHTWKDFPWYVTYSYTPNWAGSNFGKLTINILEPYVCAHCHKRMDVSLEKYTLDNIRYLDVKELIKKQISKYKDKILPIAMVEDMIHDFIYVDYEKLDILEKIRTPEKKEINNHE